MFAMHSFASSADLGNKGPSSHLRWVESDAVLRTPRPLARACSTTQPSQASPSSAVGPRWMPQIAQDALQRLQSISKTASANTPEQVKQLAAAAKDGNFVRVAKIQSNNLWLNFGGGIVAIAFACGTYTLYLTSKSVYSAITGFKDDGWTFRVLAGGTTVGILSYAVFRHQCVVSPAAVHQEALRLLRADPAIKEVLKLPLTAETPLLSIIDGGRIRFKWWLVPRWQPQRIQMSFPLTSSNTTAVAMVEAKKIWGRHLFKLLAVDVPSKAPLGPETRIFVHGSSTDFEAEQHSGASSRGMLGWWSRRKEEKMVRGRVFEELREPLKRVMKAQKAVELEDEEDERWLEAEHQKTLTEAAMKRAAQAPKPLDKGGGMYVHEYLYWKLYYGLQSVGKWLGRR